MLIVTGFLGGLAEGGAEDIQILLFDGDTRRHGMTAAAHDVITADVDGLDEGEKPGMSRPLPLPMPFSSKEKQGSWGVFAMREMREATMPTTPGCQPREPSTMA